MPSQFTKVYKQTDEYIFVNNNEKILTIDGEEDFINLYNIPNPPKLPPISKDIENKIKVKIRFNNLIQYKKYLQNKRKRQRLKNNKNVFKF